MRKVCYYLGLLILAICTVFCQLQRAEAASWVQKGQAMPGVPIYAMTVGLDGKIWVAGVGGYTAYWNGSSWVSTGKINSSNYSIMSLTTGTDGKIWAADANGYVSYWNGSAWVNIGQWPYNGYGIRALTTGKDGKIWAAGDGGWAAYWNGSSWVGTGMCLYDNNDVEALTVGTDGKIWAGGENGYTAYWNGSSWVNTGNFMSGTVYAMTTGIDGKIWASGVNGYTAYWNGSSWISIGMWPYGSINAIFALTVGTDGKIWAAGGSGYAAYWNGTQWVGKDKALTSTYNLVTCFALVTNGDGSIWAGGDYSCVASYNINNNSFSLIPSPNGATGQLVLNPRLSGESDILVQLQLSYNGADYTNLGIPGKSVLNIIPTSSTVYTRLALQFQRLPGQFQTTYSNVVQVPAISSNPNVNVSTSITVWDVARGRSCVILSWPALANATGYKLHIFDGNTYRTKDLGNITSWDSRTAKIFPFPGELPENNSVSSDIFRWDGSGLDFEDTALRLYRSTVGTGYDNDPKFYFRVTAYNQWMETDFNASSSFKVVTMPVATDAQQPAGSANAVSAEGLEKTFNPDIKVSVNASDSGSGIWKVELSNDGVSYTQKYAATKNADGGTGVTSYSNTFDWTVPLGAGTKVVYVRITDAVGNQKVVTDTIALAEDMLPPSISLLINDGATSTTTKDVTLTISVSDNASTTSQMQMAFSNDGNLWSPWEPYQQTKSWDITNSNYGGTSGSGIKKVYVRVYDQAQNVGLASAEIAYNPNPPAASGVTFTGGVSGTYNGQPAIFVKGDMPTLNVTASGASKMRYDAGIGIWSDWEPYVSSKQIVLAKSSGVCRVRVQVADSYGVASKPVETLVVVDNKAPTIIKVSGQNGTTATSTGTFYVMVQATDDMPGQLQACASVDGGAFGSWYNVPQSAIPVTLSTTGAHSITVKVKDLAGNESQANMTAFKVAA